MIILLVKSYFSGKIKKALFIATRSGPSGDNDLLLTFQFVTRSDHSESLEFEVDTLWTRKRYARDRPTLPTGCDSASPHTVESQPLDRPGLPARVLKEKI